jgi:hypothetical protein
VLEVVSQFRDVVLMNVYLDLGNPGGLGFRNEGYMNKGGNGKISLRAIWERGGRILSQQGGFQVSKGRPMGSKREWRKGKQRSKGIAL